MRPMQRDDSKTGHEFCVDPVCGMKLKKDSALYIEHQKQLYYFCSPGCLSQFSAQPHKFNPASKPSPQIVKDSLIVGRLHHPQVRQPRKADAQVNHAAPLVQLTDQMAGEFQDLKHRLMVSVVLSIMLTGIALTPWPLPLHEHLGKLGDLVVPVLQAILASVIFFWCGWPLLTRVSQGLQTRKFDPFTLVIVGITVLWISSILRILFPDWLSTRWPTDARNSPYFQAIGIIMSVVLCAKIFELQMRLSIQRMTLRLAQRLPQRVTVIQEDGNYAEVDIAQVRISDHLRIRPGSLIPCDGTVIAGRSSVDESMMNGESLPVEKHAGCKVFAGTLNQSGSFTMRVEKIGAQTLLAKILQFMQAAQRSQALIQRRIDRACAVFMRATIAVAFLIACIWAIFGSATRLLDSLVIAVSVLIIACPGMLIFSVTICLMVSMIRGAQQGILIKNPKILERLGKIDTLVINKTGILTEAHPRVQRIVSLSELTTSEILAAAASLEKFSTHPLARAITHYAQRQGMKTDAVGEFKTVIGKGVSGVVAGRSVCLGNAALMDELGINKMALHAAAMPLRNQGQTVVFLAIDQVLVGMISVSDPIKESSFDAVAQLKNAGVEIILLSGDHTVTAEVIAAQLGLQNVQGEVSVEDKYRYIRHLREQGRMVAMASDGHHDSAALALAHVSITTNAGMESTSDSAHTVANVVLVKGDLGMLAKAQRLSTGTLKHIRRSLVFGFVYHLFAIPIAAGILYPGFGILLSPVVASLVMATSMILGITYATYALRASP